MTYKEIQEGEANVLVDTAEIATKELEVFYNPDMKLNRDISIAVIKTFFETPAKIALPLAGSGIRAARIRKEISDEKIKELYVNDMSEDAYKLINENLKRNDVKAIVSQLEATQFLDQGEGFDYIDIDPFGSPNQFLDTAIRKLSRKGILAVTATDTAALAGTYPSTCKRKYWAKSTICPQKHEVGLRILARKVILLGIHHSKVLEPILSYHDRHYYRIFFKATKSRERSSEYLERTNAFLSYDPATAEHIVSDRPINEWKWAGPLYDGPMQDNGFVSEIKEIVNHKMFYLLENELPVVGYFDTHTICKKHNIALGKISDYIERLEESGFKACRVQTNQHAIKTDAPFDVVLSVIRDTKR